MRWYFGGVTSLTTKVELTDALRLLDCVVGVDDVGRKFPKRAG